MKSMFKWIKKIILTSAILIVLLASSSPVSASGKSQYFLAFLYNTETKSFGSAIIQNGGMYRAESTYSKLNTTDSLIYLSFTAGTSQMAVDGKMINPPVSMGSNQITQTTSLSSYPFTFPEFADVDGSAQDYTLASNVANQLSKSLNTAMAFILKPVSTAGRKELDIANTISYLKIAMAVSNSGFDVISSNTTSFKEYTMEKLKWSIRQATEADMKTMKDIAQGSSHKDYVVIKNYSGKTITVPYLIPKGYTEGQQLFNQQSTVILSTAVTSKLSWGHVVYLSEALFLNGCTIQNNSMLVKDDALASLLSGLLKGIISGLTSILGLYSINELMFNAGTRGATYYFGIMPMSWLNPVNVLNLFATVISLIVIGISIIRLLIRRNMAAITPSVRAELMEGVKDLFIVVIGIALFMPALYILLTFNDTIVSAIRNMAPNGDTFGIGGHTNLAEIIIQVAFVFIQTLLNINYLIRAVTLALLIGFAPFFISLFAAGDASKKIAGTWLKELISNIFMQTFNAAMLLVFANVGTFGNLSTIERMALMISFIPLSKFFKNTLMSLGSGSDAVGERTGGAFTNLAASVASGALLSSLDGKSTKNGKTVNSSDGKPLDSKLATENISPKTGTISDKTSAEQLRGGLGKFGKEALSFGSKAAAMVAGAGVSLGSAATGGSPLIGSASVIAAAGAMGNQVEGWTMKDEPMIEGIVKQGSELNNDGFSGFSGDATVFSKTAKANINSSPEEKSNFTQQVEKYNADPVNANSQAKILTSDDGQIYGASIDGVNGKTFSRKDPVTNKVIATESVYSGNESLQRFTPTLAGFSKVREKVKNEPEDNHNGSDWGSEDQDTSGT